MINIVDRLISGSLYKTVYEFTEEGDTLVVSPSTPVLGTLAVSDILVFEEHSATGSFLVSVKCSVDEGLHWSEPLPVSEFLKEANYYSIRKNHYFCFEFTLTKQGGGLSWFEGIEVKIGFDLPAIPQFYAQHKALSKIPYYNHTAISWSLNVLDKVYRRGIVPSFIERQDNLNWSDEDYINIWWSLLYPMALRISYAEVFTDLLWTPRLLQEFLEQRGLILGNISSLDELYYLMSHFYDEISRRGTLSIFDTDRADDQGFTLRGELARLIDLKNKFDLFLGLVNSHEQGWWLNETSVGGYENSDTYMNYILGYENEFGIVYKTKGINIYPLINAQNVTWLNSVNNPTLLINTPEEASLSGIGSSQVQDNAIPVNSHWKYCVIADIEVQTASTVNFGVQGFDSLGLSNDFEDLRGNQTNLFFSKTLVPGKYKLFGAILSSGNSYRLPLDGISSLLRFPENSTISQIIPKLLCQGKVMVTNFKVCMLRPNFVYLDSTLGKSFDIVLKNQNLSLTNSEIKRIVENKLFPVNINYTLNFE